MAITYFLVGLLLRVIVHPVDLGLEDVFELSTDVLNHLDSLVGNPGQMELSQRNLESLKLFKLT